MNPALVPLPDLSARLHELTGSHGPGYRKLWQHALDGTIPSVVQKNRRYVRDADLPAIAATLGLTIPAPRPRGQVTAHGAR